MKIAVLTPTWPAATASNGIVSYYGNLIPNLLALGHEVFILTFDYKRDQDVETPNLKVIEIDYGFNPLERCVYRGMDLLSPGYILHVYTAKTILESLNTILEKEKIDIIEIEDSFGWHGYVSEALDIPVVVRLHGPHFLVGKLKQGVEQTKRDTQRNKKEIEALQAAFAVSAPSHDVFNRTQSQCDVEWPSSKVIPNSTIASSPENRWSLETCNKNDILFVGRYDFIKGGDLLLKAFAKVIEKRPHLRLLFAGPDVGIRNQDDSFQAIHDHIATLPKRAQDSIQYLGRLDQSEIKKLRSTSYMTIVSSRYENFPNVVLEAMSHGSPLVATEVGGIPEIVQDGYNGLLAKPDDVHSLAARMEDLLENTELALSLSEHSYTDVLKRFNSELIVQHTVDFFENVICNYRS